MPILRAIYSIILDFAETLVIAGAIFVIFYAFFFRLHQVNGNSMYPTFKDKELVITDIISYRLQQPKRGDVVVFVAPPDAEKDYIKRIIGLPGDKVALRNGSIYVNDKKLDESIYLAPAVKSYGMRFLHDNSEITVTSGNYFVMGDNRDYSSDSRDWGLVSRDKIIGKSWIVYWPVQDFRVVPEVNYKN